MQWKVKIYFLQQRFNVKNDNIFVFTNPETNTRYGNIHKVFTTACKMANIPNFRFHDTRHTFASRATLRYIGIDQETIDIPYNSFEL